MRSATDGQSVEAQVRQLTKAGCKKVLREVESGAKADRAQLRDARRGAGREDGAAAEAHSSSAARGKSSAASEARL